jgi:membrane-associated phospholipid phosphatase
VLTSAGALAIALALQAAAASPAPRPSIATPPVAPVAPVAIVAPPPPPADRPFAELLTNLGRDVKALPSANTALIAGIGGGSAAVVRPLDDNISTWASGLSHASYTRAGDIAGNGWTQTGAAVAIYAAGLAAGSPRTTHIGSDLIRAQFLTGIITQGLKVGVRRARPGGGHHSFPSGHTSASIVTAGVLEGNFGWKAGLPAYAGAAFIAWTRLRDDQHWLTDAVIGATIGTVVGRTVALHGGAGRWTVVPAPASGGMSVVVVRTPGDAARH